GATEPGEAVAAVRAAGLSAQVASRSGLALLGREAFVRDYWRPARLEPEPVESVTAAFRRTANPASVRVALRPAPPRTRTALEVAWQLGPRRADVQASVRWTSPDVSLALLEVAVPEQVAVADVRGPGLRGWSRVGGRVLAVLGRPVSDVTLQLV